MFRLKSKSAFTLIETLVALSIIIVMAGSTIIANRAISQNTSNARIQAEEQYLIDQEMAELKFFNFLNNNNYSSTPMSLVDISTIPNNKIYEINTTNNPAVLITLNSNGSSNNQSFYSLNSTSGQCSNTVNLDSYLLKVSTINYFNSNPPYNSIQYYNTNATFDAELITVSITSCANPNLYQSQSFYLASL
jgi:type II secretory pathway pseudopilin PulG